MNRFALPPILCVLAVAAGCGSTSKKTSSTPPAPPSSSTAPSAPSSSGSAGLSVTETEYKLTPPTAKVSGGKVKVSVNNAGGTVHALEIEGGGTGGKDLKSSAVPPGASTTITASLKPGKTYEWYCPIADHKALGMKGTITVGGASASSGASGSASTSSPAGNSGGY